MSLASNKNKRPKMAELPKYKAPPMRQLKVTAFFKRGPSTDITNNSLIEPSGSISNQLEAGDKSSLLNSSLETPEITICDSDDDDLCEEVYCSEDLLAKRAEMARLEKRRKYDPTDFVDFETFNYNDELIKDKKSSKERRRCPFYKRIPYTNICVDAFNFAKESDLKYYVLSHFHADHYIGMTKGFDRPIYCTPITARLIRHKFKVAPKYIHAHELNEPFFISNIRVTFYDANHCPGAAIILFECPNFNRYLHTGDFRACPEMELIPDIRCAPIDCCFLDTTFCDRSKTFPAQQKVLEDTVAVCRYALEKDPKTLIVCGSYCIGKEKVFLAVAEALNLKVWANKYKRAYFDCIKDPRLDAVLVDKQEEAKIHVLPLKCLWKRGMREYLEKNWAHFDAIVALRPSGWEYKRNKHMVPEVEGNIAIYPVPYSEHSSYDDLERFIRWLRPRRIIPTVNMGDPLKRGQMNHIFRRWKASPLPREPLTLPALTGANKESTEEIMPADEKEIQAIEAKPKVETLDHQTPCSSSETIKAELETVKGEQTEVNQMKTKLKLEPKLEPVKQESPQ